MAYGECTPRGRRGCSSTWSSSDPKCFPHPLQGFDLEKVLYVPPKMLYLNYDLNPRQHGKKGRPAVDSVRETECGQMKDLMDFVCLTLPGAPGVHGAAGDHHSGQNLDSPSPSPGAPSPPLTATRFFSPEESGTKKKFALLRDRPDVKMDYIWDARKGPFVFDCQVLVKRLRPSRAADLSKNDSATPGTVTGDLPQHDPAVDLSFPVTDSTITERSLLKNEKGKDHSQATDGALTTPDVLSTTPVAFDVLGEGSYCPITGADLGFVRFKKRLLSKLNMKYFTLKKRAFDCLSVDRRAVKVNNEVERALVNNEVLVDVGPAPGGRIGKRRLCPAVSA